MLRRIDMNVVVVCFMFALMVCPNLVIAGLDTTALNNEATSIKTFLFSTPIKIAGILGGAYGLIQAMVSSSVRPLLVYGGIGLGANIIPIFIDTVFKS